MTLAGFATFSDTPLIDAATAIEDLRRDGVKVKILTGDNELVANHVCEQLAYVPAGSFWEVRSPG